MNADRRTALLVMVHGSPRPVANDDMFAVVAQVRDRGLFDTVSVGFMECNEPTIPAAIAACVAQGVRRIIAVPYFLHIGNHVADDLPSLIADAQTQYPTVEFLMGDWLGHDPALEGILWDRFEAAVRSSASASG